MGGPGRSILALAVASAIGAQAAHAQQLEEVVVTGTRIAQPDFVFSNPVTSVDAEAIERSGETNLTTFLTEVPALTGSLDSFDSGGSEAFIGGAGINLLDLRNLGFDRTLVLINGRRHVGTLAESSAVDINSIPIELVERVDVLTGGVSAIYGADGVTGVVNFVLRDDFEGLSLRAQSNQPSDSGAGSSFLSATYGHNFGDNDRGNVAVAVERTTDKLLYGYDRDYNGDRRGVLSRFVRNPADTADPPDGDGPEDSATVPDLIPLELTAFGDTSRCGAVFTTFSNGPSPDFNCDGSPWDSGELPPQTVGGFQDFPILPFHQVGGDATLQDDYVGFSTIQPEIERTAVNAFLTFELNRRAEVFAEIKHVKSEVFNASQPSFDFYLHIEPDNPFVPAALQAEPLALPGYFMSRDNIDLGIRADAIDRTTDRVVFGVRGEATSWADYEVSLTYGKSEVVSHQLNNRFEDRFFAALDVVDNGGTPNCRVNVDPSALPNPISVFSGVREGPIEAITYDPAAGNCVPLNLFGEFAASPEAVAWVMNATTAVDEIEQSVLSAYLTGDSGEWFNLPGGPMGFAYGIEHREEKSASTPDPLDTLGATFGNAILANAGEFDVSEVFGELSLPVLSGVAFAEQLTFEAAYRFSDYSTIGETSTWKLGLQWAPIRNVTFRATTAETVRAPNISEAYGAENQTFEPIEDPCDVSLLNDGTRFREQNCAEILSGLGVDPDSFVDPNTAAIGGVSSGNVNIREEIADTRTAGVVFTPGFADGLLLAIDWYDITLNSAIELISPEEIAGRCVDAPSIDNQFCPLIDRAMDTGAIDSFRLAPVNIAQLETSGVDVTLSYTLDASSGNRNLGLFGFRLIGNRLHQLDFLPSPGGVIDEDVGEAPTASFTEQPVPEYQATFDLTWERGPLSVNYGLQWFDKTQRISNRRLHGDADLPEGDRDRIPAAFYYYDAKLKHDLSMRYALPAGVSVYGGVNNLTDEGPGIDSLSHPVSPVGRTYYLGVRADFSSL